MPIVGKSEGVTNAEVNGQFVVDTAPVKSQYPDIPTRVRVFDTTLRDGEQTPGVNLPADSKMRIARALDEMGVDVIEAGFPASSEGERELFKNISADGTFNAKICGLCRCSREDIDYAVGSGADYVHVFIATSDLHMKYKLRMTREQVLQKAIESVTYVNDHGIPCEFSCEDATRSDLDFVKQVYSSAAKSGASMLNVPDTVGAAIPRTMFRLVNEIRNTAPMTPISMHCHDDFGLATANTLAGVEAGAQQVQVTVNGLGERAGNAALEEVVMALDAIYGVKSGIKSEKLFEVSQLVSKLAKVWPSPNKAVVGENAFAHASGIHVHGVQSHSLAYEPFSPSSVGQKRKIVFGKLTGINAVRGYLADMGFAVTDEQARIITDKVKEIGDKGRRVRDFELAAIAEEALGRKADLRIRLGQVLITTGNTIIPTSSLKVTIDGVEKTASATGVGPVDAALSALAGISKQFGEVTLKEYRLEAISGGSDALCEVTTILSDKEGDVEPGFAVGPDIVMTSIEAMVSGMNRLFAKNGKEASGPTADYNAEDRDK
jgi:isopropylmalate/citramalate/homocitrate synthase-like protein